MSCPRVKRSISETLNFDGVETEVSLSDIVQQLQFKNADVPDIRFTLNDTFDLSPTLILNQNATAKEREIWVPLEI